MEMRADRRVQQDPTAQQSELAVKLGEICHQATRRTTTKTPMNEDEVR